MASRGAVKRTDSLAGFTPVLNKYSKYPNCRPRVRGIDSVVETNLAYGKKIHAELARSCYDGPDSILEPQGLSNLNAKILALPVTGIKSTPLKINKKELVIQNNSLDVTNDEDFTQMVLTFISPLFDSS